MNTEITKINDGGRVRAWVLYDADCQFCVALARRCQRVLTTRHFALAPLQAPWVAQVLGQATLPQGVSSPLSSTSDGREGVRGLGRDLPQFPWHEMALLTAEGRRFGGADALIQIARAYWWIRPLTTLSQLPGAMTLLRAMYRWVAARRYCQNGVRRRGVRQPGGAGKGGMA